MAAAISHIPEDVSKPNPVKKGKGRKPLKNISSSEANISVAKLPVTVGDANKENIDGISLLVSPSKIVKPITKPKAAAAAAAKRSSDDELQELQARLEQLRIEKEKTEDLLRERDELLKQKQEELDKRGEKQEKLQKDLEKLQKLKGFLPNMTIPVVQSLREKEQTKKKNKDGPEKKKPSPPYILYCKEQRNEVKKENPNASFRDISNIMGGKWRSLSAEEKKPYEEKYQQDKDAYLQMVGKKNREKEALKLLEEEKMQKTAMDLLEQYLQFKQEAGKENAKAKKERDPLKPKHPMSAFFLFSNERRAALTGENKNVLEIAKIAGEEWKNMTEELKAPYEEIAKKQKEEYAQRMELFTQRKAEKEEEELNKIMKHEALQLFKKKENLRI